MSESYGFFHNLLYNLSQVISLLGFFNNSSIIIIVLHSLFYWIYISPKFSVVMVEYTSPLMLMHTKYHFLQTTSEVGSLTCTFRSGDYRRRVSSWKVHRPKYTTTECFVSFQQLYKYFYCAQQSNKIPKVKMLCPCIIHQLQGRFAEQKTGVKISGSRTLHLHVHS